MNDGVMTYEDWLRSRVYYDGKDGFVTLLCEDVLEIADCIERLKESNANQRIQDVKNNYTPQTDCNPTCEFYDEQCLSVDCYGCCDGYSRYKPKDEPQLVKEGTEVVKDLVKDTPQTDLAEDAPRLEVTREEFEKIAEQIKDVPLKIERLTDCGWGEPNE